MNAPAGSQLLLREPKAPGFTARADARHTAATRAWLQGRLSVGVGASPRARRSVARLGLPRQVHAMTGMMLLPFRPDAMTPDRDPAQQPAHWTDCGYRSRHAFATLNDMAELRT